MKRIKQTFLTLTATAALAVVSAPAAIAGLSEASQHGEFIPGVTDFPARPATFIPGVTDFPVRPAVEPHSVSAGGGGLDWSDAGIAAGLVAILALLGAAAIAALRRRSKALLGTAVLGVAVLAASVGGGLDLNHNETVLRD